MARAGRGHLATGAGVRVITQSSVNAAHVNYQEADMPVQVRRREDGTLLVRAMDAGSGRPAGDGAMYAAGSRYFGRSWRRDLQDFLRGCGAEMERGGLWAARPGTAARAAISCALGLSADASEESPLPAGETDGDGMSSSGHASDVGSERVSSDPWEMLAARRREQRRWRTAEGARVVQQAFFGGGSVVALASRRAAAGVCLKRRSLATLLFCWEQKQEALARRQGEEDGLDGHAVASPLALLPLDVLHHVARVCDPENFVPGLQMRLGDWLPTLVPRRVVDPAAIVVQMTSGPGGAMELLVTGDVSELRFLLMKTARGSGKRRSPPGRKTQASSATARFGSGTAEDYTLRLTGRPMTALLSALDLRQSYAERRDPTVVDIPGRFFDAPVLRRGGGDGANS
jgi:hypothetical protein